MILVVPKVGDVPLVVRVPVRVLTTGSGVQIQNGVDPVFCTEVDHPIEVLEPLFLKDSRVLVV